LHPQRVSRRRFLALAGGAAALSSCSGLDDDGDPPLGPDAPAARVPVRGDDPEVGVLESRRTNSSARIVTALLTARPFGVDLAGRQVQTWGYGSEIPGRLLRATAGEVLDVKIRNLLPAATSVHWHGLALRNDMDGVNDLTQPPIGPGQDFTYRFALAHPGTYWFHPHVGTQLDRGLYAPLIVDDPAEPGRYDAEHVLVLDDWLDGFDTTPDAVLAGLRGGQGGAGSGSSSDGGSGGGGGGGGEMPGMDHGGGGGPMTTMAPGMDHSRPMGGTVDAAVVRPVALAAGPEEEPSGPRPGPPETGTGTGVPGGAMGQFTSPLLGGDSGDVAYAVHLINGKPPPDRPTFVVPAQGRARLRVINAGSDTAYRFAIGGHRMTVTHTDGYPVQPIEVDTIVIGMGERYDIVVTAQSGAWPIVAVAEGKRAAAVAVLRTTDATQTAAPPVDALPIEMFRRVLEYRSLRAAEAVRLGGAPQTTVEVDLVGDMATYRWAIRASGTDRPIEVEEGAHVRLNLRNTTTMWHPVHLHGHTFALADTPGGGGARKDTVNVLPGKTVPIDFVADNAGQWMLHCHNTYHFEAGMMTTVSYVR
jgi:FtsP/CotA-like multicopper oxidase with cupredoxin domain